MITQVEAEKLQELILDHDSPGAESFPLAGHYEVHPRGEPGIDFPQPVQDYLSEIGFKRVVDRQRGPFYYR